MVFGGDSSVQVCCQLIGTILFPLKIKKLLQVLKIKELFMTYGTKNTSNTNLLGKILKSLFFLSKDVDQFWNKIKQIFRWGPSK